MLFIYTIDQVLNGTKTNSRRVVQPGEYPVFDESGNIIEVRKANGRLKWKVGKTYGAQPGRGQKAVARIRITGIRKEHVQDITPQDAYDEGIRLSIFTIVHDNWDVIEKLEQYRREFSQLWDSVHGPGAWEANPEVWCLSFELAKG